MCLLSSSPFRSEQGSGRQLKPALAPPSGPELHLLRGSPLRSEQGWRQAGAGVSACMTVRSEVSKAGDKTMQ